MKIRTANKLKSGSQKRAEMACKKLKKAASDVFSKKTSMPQWSGEHSAAKAGFCEELMHIP